ncbi:MAG: dihydrolipoyl dehydrogenase [Candidatus Brocadiae bacterium]|nr:dihydrolipoyl dehydrogenase [Candidatus Brocadiia bacterium]
MDYDLLIVGAGPAGYVAGIRAGQLGLKAAIIEKGHLGGMCLNWGCIPTKSLLESARLYKKIKKAEDFGIDGIFPKTIFFNWQKAIFRTRRIVDRLSKGISMLLEKNGVTLIQGTGEIASPTCVIVERRMISAPNIFLATGSKPKNLDLPVPKEMMLEIEDLFQLEILPESIVIVGNGSTAVELCQFFAMIGKQVNLVSEEETILPALDPYLSDFAEKKLRSMGVGIFLKTKITGYDKEGVLCDEQKIACQKILNSQEREAILPFSTIPIDKKDGFVKVNGHLQTNYSSIFAIGDINGIQTLAHVASAQALHAVNYIKGIDSPLDYCCCPLNMYSEPEMAQAGLTEPQLKKAKVEYKITEFPLSANAKAMIEGSTEGILRLLSERKYGEVLGVQIIAPHATDMISEAVAIMQMEGTIYDVAKVMHAHPTTSEIFLEAGWAAIDKALHL